MKTIAPFLLLLFFGCSKNNSSTNNSVNTGNDLKSQLTGNWKITEYVAADFNSTNGRPQIPNDTIYPVHDESCDFTADSVSFDTWETNTYDYTTNPYSFSNSQTKEFITTTSYFVGSNYFVSPGQTSNDPNDTFFVKSISSSQLLLYQNVYVNFQDPSSGVLYIWNMYLQK